MEKGAFKIFSQKQKDKKMRYLKDKVLSSEAQALVKKYDSLGFTGFNLPGGTSREGGHYSGGVIYRFNDKKQVEILVLPYDGKVKDPVETSKQENEKPMQTLIRELLEETLLQVTPKDVELVEAATVVLPARPPKKEHTKYCYLVHSFKGEPGNFDDQDNGRNPIDPETGTPFWVSVDVFEEIIFPTHRMPLGKALGMLMARESKYAFSLMNNPLVLQA